MLKRVVIGLCLAVAGTVVAQSEKSYLVSGENVAEDPFMKDVAAFLETNEHYNIASYDGTAARVRPVKFVCVLNNKVALATSNKKEMYLQMKEHPGVEFSRTAKDGSAYIRYLGKAVECEDQKLIDALLAKHDWPKKKFKENMAIFLIEPEMAGIFSMKGQPAKTKIFNK